MPKRERYFSPPRSPRADLVLITLIAAVLIVVSAHRFTTRTETEQRQQKARLLLEQIYRLQRVHFEQFGTYVPISPGRNADVLKLDGAHPFEYRVDVPDSASFVATAWADLEGQGKLDVWTVDQDHPTPLHREKEKD